MNRCDIKRVRYFERAGCGRKASNNLFATTLTDDELFREDGGDNLDPAKWVRIFYRDAVKKFGFEAVEYAKLTAGM